MSSKLANAIMALLKDMESGRLSDVWSVITKSAIAESILALTKLDSQYRQPMKCVNTPTVSCNSEGISLCHSFIYTGNCIVCVLERFKYTISMNEIILIYIYIYIYIIGCHIMMIYWLIYYIITLIIEEMHCIINNVC